jgi:hypothetical protein
MTWPNSFRGHKPMKILYSLKEREFRAMNGASKVLILAMMATLIT